MGIIKKNDQSVAWPLLTRGWAHWFFL